MAGLVNNDQGDAMPLLMDPPPEKPPSQASSSSAFRSGLERLSDLVGIPKLIQYREDLNARTERPIFDLFILVVCYFGTGTTFYALCDEDFTPMSRGRVRVARLPFRARRRSPPSAPRSLHPRSRSYAFFYATNVGLGVGYGNYHIRDIFTKWFTVFYIMAGSSLVIGSLSVFFNHVFHRIGKRTNAGANTLFRVACYMYVFMVLVGVIIGYKFEGYNSFVDALLFAVGNYTTAGLIEPHDSSSSLLWTTLSLFFGIPLNFIVMGQVASRVLHRYYPDDAGPALRRRNLSTDRLDVFSVGKSPEEAYILHLETLLSEKGVSRADLDRARAEFQPPEEDPGGVLPELCM